MGNEGRSGGPQGSKSTRSSEEPKLRPRIPPLPLVALQDFPTGLPAQYFVRLVRQPVGLVHRQAQRLQPFTVRLMRGHAGVQPALTTGAERSAYPPPQGHDGLLHGGWLYQAHRVPVAVWTQRQADRAPRADVDAVGPRQGAEALLEMDAAPGEQVPVAGSTGVEDDRLDPESTQLGNDDPEAHRRSRLLRRVDIRNEERVMRAGHVGSPIGYRRGQVDGAVTDALVVGTEEPDTVARLEHRLGELQPRLRQFASGMGLV